MKLTLKVSRGLEVMIEMQEPVVLGHDSKGFGMGFNLQPGEELPAGITFLGVEINFEGNEVALLPHLQWVEHDQRQEAAKVETMLMPDLLAAGKTLMDAIGITESQFVALNIAEVIVNADKWHAIREAAHHFEQAYRQVVEAVEQEITPS